MFFLKNDFLVKTYVFKKSRFLFDNYFVKNIMSMLFNLFFFKTNFLVLDSDFNYNYLPVGNSLFKKKNFYKTVKYFNVKVLLFLNLKPRNFKDTCNLNLINISITTNNRQMDFFSKIGNLKIFQYMLYIFILSIYLNK